MPSIDDFTDIQISRENIIGSQSNFHVATLITYTAPSGGSSQLVANVPQRVSKASSLTNLGYDSDSSAHKWAKAYFAVEEAPNYLWVINSVDGSKTEIETTYTAMENSGNFFYGVGLAESNDDAVAAHALGEAVESRGKHYCVVRQSGSDQTGAPAVGTDLVAAALNLGNAFKNAGAQRVQVPYTATPLDDYPDAAVLGYMMGQETAAAYTLHLKVIGTDPQIIDDTVWANFGSYNVNIVAELGGTNYYLRGVSSGGEYADVIAFIDEIRARMQIAVFNAQSKAKKIPGTPDGATLIETAVLETLQWGQDAGGIAAYEVAVTDPMDRSDADKVARFYDGITWEATLTDAIHNLKIGGNVGK